MKQLIFNHILFTLIGLAYLLGAALQVITLGIIRIDLPANEIVYRRAQK
jgi:hypothetical protein